MNRAHSDAFGLGKPVRIPKALKEALEDAVQAHLGAVEKLLSVLDKADGDENLEPSLASGMGWGGGNATDNQEHWALGSNAQDREGGDVQDEPHDEEDEGNREPSLSLTNDIDQVRALRHSMGLRGVPGSEGWYGTDSDLEAEHDGREPSLGAPERNAAQSCVPAAVSQLHWAQGGADDRENDGDDREPDVDDEPRLTPVIMDGSGGT